MEASKSLTAESVQSRMQTFELLLFFEFFRSINTQLALQWTRMFLVRKISQ